MAQSFGGDWTEDKLDLLRKYLVPYAKIMSKRNFRFAYIDAFAGTGYREKRRTGGTADPLFPELAEQESQEFMDGSARLALRIEPRFSNYIFNEQDPERFTELAKLKTLSPEKGGDIELVNADANAWLIDRCLNRKWKKHRAIVFLDPFGMQVEWKTVKAIANTKAIDLWVLFPLGIATNRLLRKDGRIPQGWKQRLDKLFGTDEWFDVFYRTHTDLFGRTRAEKTVNLNGIGLYYLDRLRTLFPHVVDNPRPLYNSTGNPLYLFCFASHNKIAVKIAQNILSR
jgi:three-Cys-motif partner protein